MREYASVRSFLIVGIRRIFVAYSACVRSWHAIVCVLVEMIECLIVRRNYCGQRALIRGKRTVEMPYYAQFQSIPGLRCIHLAGHR